MNLLALLLAALITYIPQPPGTVVQSRVVYLSGESMHGQWRAVVSKRLVGTGAGGSFYQWYFSIYARRGEVYDVKYQSPRMPVPFDRVTRASGGSMWFPAQSGEIAGAAEFMAPGVQQLVVSSQQTGADCGSARVDVFAYDAASDTVKPVLSLENYCRLDAKIVSRPDAAAELRLTGPYYAKDAPTCCPTKNNVTAIVRFVNGRWIETPKTYFEIMKKP